MYRIYVLFKDNFCQGPLGHFCVATTTTAPGHKNGVFVCVCVCVCVIFKAAMADRILEVNLVLSRSILEIE